MSRKEAQKSQKGETKDWGLRARLKTPFLRGFAWFDSKIRFLESKYLPASALLWRGEPGMFRPASRPVLSLSLGTDLENLGCRLILFLRRGSGRFLIHTREPLA